MHEAQLHEENCFVTLTYDDEHLPDGGRLVKADMQKFWKRLRHHVGSVRYYYCGEYGDEGLRPHYHACIFGYSPPDKRHLMMRGEHRLYSSESLAAIWGNGFVSIGDVTFESAGYCARYVTKKLTSPKSCEKCTANKECPDCKRVREKYERLDPSTGEIYSVPKEFADMSRRPGIGRTWINRYGKEVYHADSVIVNGREVHPPKYYDTTLSEEELLFIKERRLQRSVHGRADRTLARLRVRETVKEAAIKSLRRSL
jgi:hypothetical protein